MEVSAKRRALRYIMYCSVVRKVVLVSMTVSVPS